MVEKATFPCKNYEYYVISFLMHQHHWLIFSKTTGCLELTVQKFPETFIHLHPCFDPKPIQFGGGGGPTADPPLCVELADLHLTSLSLSP